MSTIAEMQLEYNHKAKVCWEVYQVFQQKMEPPHKLVHAVFHYDKFAALCNLMRDLRSNYLEEID